VAVSASSTQHNRHKHNKNPQQRSTMTENDDGFSAAIGGGAVNEKKRFFLDSLHPEDTEEHNNYLDGSSQSNSRYNPTQHRAHLFHAMEGLDRYPNYLSRWEEPDIDALERALQEKLQQVRDQKSKITQQRQEMQRVLQRFLECSPEWKEFVQAPSTWEDIQTKILDQRAAKAIFRSQMFLGHKDNMSVEDVLRGRIPIKLDTAQLEQLMDEEMDDVFAFPLLSQEFCTKLHTFVSAFLEAMEASPPLQTITRGIHKDLDNMGMGWLNDLLFHLITRPIAAQLYKETELAKGDLDWRQGFIASYSADPTQSKPRQRLVPHTDDAEVTLNVCLGDKFDGGDLMFWGLRGERNTLLGEYEPEVGRAVIHSGRHLHEVTRITAGNRFAYIQWTRSWGSARKETCPCCWLNRRGLSHTNNNQDSCICGPRWN
jgi:hypothetical protein